MNIRLFLLRQHSLRLIPLKKSQHRIIPIRRRHILKLISNNTYCGVESEKRERESDRKRRKKGKLTKAVL